MQTFMSEKSFSDTASMLDNKRLNKQILEGRQILNILSNYHPKKAWANHPAVLMWRGSEHILYSYIKVMANDADKRGIKTDTNMQAVEELYRVHNKLWGKDNPKWFNKEELDRVVMTHRANLYKKDPEYYWQYKYAVDNELNKPCCEKCKYYWATHKERNV